MAKNETSLTGTKDSGVVQTSSGGDTSFRKTGGTEKSYGDKGFSTSAAGLGAYAKSKARPTPGPRVTPTPPPRIATPMDESITAK